MPTAEEIAASKALQEQEGLSRKDPIDDQGNRAPDPRSDPSLDNTGAQEPDAPRGGDDDGAQPQRRERSKPIHMSPSDEARANIAKRFRRDAEGEVPFNGDPNDPEMMYGKFGRPPEQQVDPEPQPQPEAEHGQQDPQPEKKYKIKVRRGEIELTEAEVLERAAKVEAADSYLAESRELLEQARAIRKEHRERDPADPRRPEDRNNAQDDHADLSLSADPQHPEDELEGAIEEVRYGTDSKEAAKKLRTVLTKEADKAADDRQLKRLIANDDAKSGKVLQAFRESNPDLAKDPTAEMVIANNIFAIQREELKQLGIDESKLPKDNATLAKWHQHWRVHGHPVSNQEEMLNKARDRFVQWKGGNPSKPQSQPRKESPRVEVNVNRDQRRANLPNQPTRTMAPPPAQPRQGDSGQPRSRSDVIANMRKSRGQLVAG